MNPNNSSQGGDQLGPVGSSTPQNSSGHDHQTAAANVIRSQIDALYGGRPALERDYSGSVQQSQAVTQHTQPAQPVQPEVQATTQQPLQSTDPYNRTHTQHPRPQAEQWKEYHSAWQNYYQKYYESYYEHKRKQEAAAAPAAPQTQATNTGYFSSDNQQQPQAQIIEDEELDKNQALFELRQKLLKKVSGRAEKIRKSKHFIPIAAALGVVLIFVFLQYNRVFIATVNAYVSPGSMDPQNIVIDPTAEGAVSQDPRLIIPKINVDVPALYGVGTDHDSQMAAMEKGVAHFGIPGANSRPGEIGNTVLSGHSSNDLLDRVDYKFIFAQLEKLKQGDTIYANYEGKRYTYVVTKMEVVKPTQVDKLIYPTDKPVLTLITCTPLGTARDRLLVTAEQISPDPASAASAPAGSGESNGEAEIPGNSPTFLEKLFGIR
jgi:sortase A